MRTQRVILHVDVDAFYVACERHRRPDLLGCPVAVTQQNSGGFVAVSREARAAGIRKGDGIGAGGHASLSYFKNRPDALMAAVKAKCPELVVLPMDTDWYRTCSRGIRDRLASADFGAGGGAPVRTVVEQASIDDYYLDATEAVAARLAAGCGLWGTGEDDDDDGDDGAEASTDAVGVYVEADAAAAPLRGEWRAAAAVGAAVRACVRDGFPGITCSVGAARNKLLARLVSKRPGAADATTVLLPEATPALLRVVPLGKVPGLRGKAGAAVAAHTGAEVLADLAGCAAAELAAVAGGKLGAWLHAAARGEDASPVVPNAPPKSLLVEASFPPAAAPATLHAHAAALSATLLRRAQAHHDEHRQYPARLVVTIRRGYGGLTSKRCPVPPPARQHLAGSGDGAAAAAALADAAVATAAALCGGVLTPVTRVALTFGFDPAAAAPSAPAGQGVKTLDQFWAMQPSGKGVQGDEIVIE